MNRAELEKQYQKFSPEARHLLQLAAIHDTDLTRTDLSSLSAKSGWTNSRNSKLTPNLAKPAMGELTKAGWLAPAPRNKSRLAVREDVLDFATQQAILEGEFERFTKQIERQEAQHSSSWYYYDQKPHRDIRIAFYSGNVKKWQETLKRSIAYRFTLPPLHLLQPFHAGIFQGLLAEFQMVYLLGAVWEAISHAEGEPEGLGIFPNWFSAQPKPSEELQAARLALAVCQADRDALRELAGMAGLEQTAAGCLAFLDGDFERAEACLEQEWQQLRKETRKKNVAITGMAGVLHLLLSLRRNTAESRKQSLAICKAGAESWEPGLRPLAELLTDAVQFLASPEDDARDELKQSIAETLTWPTLPQIFAVFAWKWFDPEQKIKVPQATLEQAAKNYDRLGLRWLAALAEDAAGLGRGGDPKPSPRHQTLLTRTFQDWIVPEPPWQRTLTAISQIVAPAATATAAREDGQAGERLIWEVHYSTGRNWYVSLHPFVQKRTAGGNWSKGRPVALSRLYGSFNLSEFDYLTDQDRQVCKALKRYSEYNYGYNDIYYAFDLALSMEAVIGHPLTFRQGDRKHPLLIARREPKLLVKKSGGQIRLVIDPTPPTEGKLALINDGPDRLGVVLFTSQQMKLASLLASLDAVPGSAADKVLEAAQSVAGLITIHSEVGGATSEKVEEVPADSRPQLQMMPYQAGLRVEFFVRPFGDAGAFHRPGEGGANVFAEVGGQARATARNLKQETSRVRKVVETCPSLQKHGDVKTLDYQLPTALEALEFLSELQPLQESQVVVLHWPQGQPFRLAGEVGLPQFQLAIRKDRDWFAATGSVEVNSELTLDMLKLITLLESSPSRFVQLDDGRFLALTAQLRKRVEELAAYSEQMKDKLRIPALRAAALADVGEGLQLKTDKHWREALDRFQSLGEFQPDPPSTLQAELRPYQLDGFRWLARLAEWGAGGCLADDMGLGKTVQALALLLRRAPDGPALVVAPTSVGFNWISEALRFAPTLNMHLLGSGDRDAILEAPGPRDVVVTTYGLFNFEAERLQKINWHTVILDEAQAIKNMTTKRSQVAMSLNADFRLIMTGTPLENHLGELWNLFQFINPGLLGSLEQFQEKYAGPIERLNSPDARQRLRRLIQPFILRRTKTQVLTELPARTEVMLKVVMDEKEAAFYEALRQRAVTKLAEIDNPNGQHLRILAELMRLRRACCHPDLVAPELKLSGSKLALFSETIDELLENRHKALVFSQFVDHLSILKAELDRKGVKYQYLDGSTPAKARQTAVEAFQNGEGDVFLISLRAGGVGLNLTAADYVLHMDPWWNPAVEDQASDRAHRIGQQRPVTIYRFITQGTIEERITELHASKRDLADSLLEGADVSGKLTAEELLKLIR